MVSIKDQTLLIIKKNFTVSFRDQDYITEFGFPLAGIILAIITKM